MLGTHLETYPCSNSPEQGSNPAPASPSSRPQLGVLSESKVLSQVPSTAVVDFNTNSSSSFKKIPIFY